MGKKDISAIAILLPIPSPVQQKNMDTRDAQDWSNPVYPVYPLGLTQSPLEYEVL